MLVWEKMKFLPAFAPRRRACMSAAKARLPAASVAASELVTAGLVTRDFCDRSSVVVSGPGGRGGAAAAGGQGEGERGE